MNVDQFREVAAKRKAINAQDEVALVRLRAELSAVLLADLDATMAFIENQATAEELGWMSEVFIELFRQAQAASKSVELVASIRKAFAKYPEQIAQWHLNRKLDLMIRAAMPERPELIVDQRLRQRFKLDE